MTMGSKGEYPLSQSSQWTTNFFSLQWPSWPSFAYSIKSFISGVFHLRKGARHR